MIDANVCDVRGTMANESGKRGPLDLQACTVNVWVQYFRCNGAACQAANTLQRTCVGRRAAGPACTGPAGDELPG